MKKFLNFLTKIKTFWKFYRDYEYDGEEIRFIVNKYYEILTEKKN